MRLRRSLLFVPGSTPERIAKAIGTETDGVILDLEDAVAPAEKPRAREWVVAALRSVDFRGKERIVRVNALDGPWGADDLAAVVPVAPEAVVLPKASTPEQVTDFADAVTRHEATAGLEPGRVRLGLLLETVEGVLNAVAIARASARAVALFFGAGDLARETRGRLVPGRASELYALSHVLFAARAAGVDALDAPYFDLADEAGLEAHTRVALELGYDGKTLIHPKQIDPVNRLFTPSPEAVERARRVVTAYDTAEAAGSGALTLDGQFVDAVHVAMARETLRRAQLAGVA
jgi:citrate lyase subunit beta/citryl-CoA lyase